MNVKGQFVKLRKTDYDRIVLTDVLPYELPFILTNEGFYNAIKSKLIERNEILTILLNQKEDTKPFEYLINKNATSSRKLYLLHPASQREFINLYKDYNLLITHLCSRSSFSLRAPFAVASIYYEKGYNHFRKTQH